MMKSRVHIKYLLIIILYITQPYNIDDEVAILLMIILIDDRIRIRIIIIRRTYSPCVVASSIVLIIGVLMSRPLLRDRGDENDDDEEDEIGLLSVTV
jgi:hypothetical protein